MTSINIPDAVTSIGDGAFTRCDRLTSINIPDAVISIGDYAFSGCRELTSITIPHSVISLGDYAFSDCDKLTSINIPDRVSRVGDGLFENCFRLHSVNIPKSAISIGYDAFKGCSSLRSVIFPNTVKYIKEGAFLDAGLTSVTVNWTKPLEISTYVFTGPLSMDTLYVPIETQNAYRTTPVWKDFKIQVIKQSFSVNDINYTITSSSPPTVEVGLNTAFVGSANIPATVTNASITYSVTRIGSNAFKNCTGLTSVNIPNSVTAIGASAFSECSNLASVNIPNVVKNIGASAFEKCSSLASVSIPNSVTTIGASAFAKCSSLASVSIPNSLTIINATTFSECSNLASVNIPNVVKSIGASAFAKCSSLTSINIPNSVMNIGQQAFADAGLTSITVKWVTPLAVNANIFNGVILSAVTLYVPDTARKRYSTTPVWKDFKIEVFGQKFTNDDIKYTVTSLIPPTVAVAKNSSFIGKANIPATVNSTSISGNGNVSTSITNASITYDVTSIEEEAFAGCKGLTSVNIPQSVTNIGDRTFSDCSALTSVTVHWTTPLEVNANVFENITIPNVILYVPDGTQDAYKNTPVWKDFKIAVISGVYDFDVQDNLIQVSPNPVSHSFTVSSLYNLEGNFSYTIIDVEGRIVTQGNSSYTKPINTENLATGNYIINITTEQGKQVSQKLIKN